LQFMSSLRELLGEVLSRTGLGIYFARDPGAALDPEALRPQGNEHPLGPRATWVEARGPGRRYLLKRWQELTPDARRDLLRRLSQRESLGAPRFLGVVACGEKIVERRFGYVYCVQEYRSRTLSDYLQALGGPCPIDEGARIIRQVAIALGDAHKRGITHGNLSPDAVFVGEVGGADAGNVVLDLVRFSGLEMGRDAALTVMDLFPSGRTYLAPEQLLGSPPDELSDMFLLGVMAYEVFAGRPPFVATGTSTTQKVKSILAAQLDPPGRYRADLPNRWEAAILQLLRKERRQRYKDAESFLQAVDG